MVQIHDKKKGAVVVIFNLILRLVLFWKNNPEPYKILQKAPNKILVIRLDHIGDIIMTIPALRAIREHYKNTEIIILGSANVIELLKNEGIIDRFMIYNWPWPYDNNNRFTLTNIKKYFILLSQLRKESIELLIEFRGDLRFVILFGLFAGIKFRVSSLRSGGNKLLTVAAPYKKSTHEVEKSLEIIKSVGIQTLSQRPRLTLSNEDYENAKRITSHITSDSIINEYVVISPSSAKRIKSWPYDNFKSVVSHITKEYGRNVFVVGNYDDTQIGEYITENNDFAFSLTGKTSLRILAAILSKADLVIGIDGGVLHIASCFDIPIIALFGPTRPEEFAPITPFVHILEAKVCECDRDVHLKCSVPFNGYAKCMSALQLKTVINEIDMIYQQK
jgi:ADP-heptose:LPS heptosyltransferase